MIFAKQKLLYGWMNRHVFTHTLSECSPEDLERADEITASWERAQEKATALAKSEAGLADEIEVSEIDSELSDKLDYLREQPVFRNTFKNCSTEFKMVEIDKLIAYSFAIRLRFVDFMKQKYPPNPSVAELVDICLPLTVSQTEVTRKTIDPLNYLYSSDSMDLRIIDVISKPVRELDLSNIAEGSPMKALIVLLGFGFPMVLVASAGKRLVLDNGYHRLYALRSLGVKRVPAVVTDSLRYAEKAMSVDYLARAPRPPLFKDFFDPDLAIEVAKPRLRRSIKISITSQFFEAPI